MPPSPAGRWRIRPAAQEVETGDDQVQDLSQGDHDRGRDCPLRVAAVAARPDGTERARPLRGRTASNVARRRVPGLRWVHGQDHQVRHRARPGRGAHDQVQGQDAAHVAQRRSGVEVRLVILLHVLCRIARDSPSLQTPLHECVRWFAPPTPQCYSGRVLFRLSSSDVRTHQSIAESERRAGCPAARYYSGGRVIAAAITCYY
eukprot:7391706-Prymnesium_polylepis.1